MGRSNINAKRPIVFYLVIGIGATKRRERCAPSDVIIEGMDSAVCQLKFFKKWQICYDLGLAF